MSNSSERKTMYEVEREQFKEWIVHGQPGHTGYKCGQCARESLNMVEYTPNSREYWQNLQINWQESIDGIMSDFDASVAAHFPVHQPQNCQTCPVKPVLPEKPNPPTERQRYRE